MKTMKNKLLALLLTAIMVLTMLPVMAFAADGPKVTVTADKSAVKAGDTVTFTVSVTSDAAIGTLQFSLDIPDGMSFVEGSGTLLKTKADFGIDELSFTEKPYKIFIMADASFAELISAGTYEVMTFKCTVNDDATGSMSVGVKDGEALDAFLDPTGFDSASATVTVKGAAHEHVGEGEWQKNDTNHWKVCGCGVKVDEAAHTWDSGNVLKEANCKETGIKQYTCTVCSAKKNETIAIDPNNHNMTDWGHDEGTYGKHFKHCTNGCGYTEEEACYGGTATCKAPAICKVCGVNYGELGAHVYDENVWTPEADGHSHLCTVCKESTTAVKESHVDSDNNQKCDKCGYDMPCAHSWNSGEVTKSATCTTEGIMTYTCGLCHGTKTEPIPVVPTAHKWDSEEWTSDGTNHWHKCLNGCTEKKDVTPCTGGNAATCQEKSVCDTCHQAYGEFGDHNWNESSWDMDTNNHWHTCQTAGCDAIKDKAAHVDNDNDKYCDSCKYDMHCDHVWNNGVVTTPSTCTTEGVKTFTCTKCGETKTAPLTIDPDNHVGDTEIRNAEEATCTEAGYTGDTYCKSCDNKISDGEVIKATGHNYGEWDVKTPATCTEDGVKVHYCLNCKDEETDKIPATDHDYGEWSVKTPATCTEDGVKAHYCTRCQNEETDKIPATGHAWGEWKTVEEPTYDAEGSAIRVCANDDSHVEDKSIPKLVKDDPTNPTDPTKPVDNNKPDTGDAGVGIWVAVLTVSALFGTAIVVKKRHA